jgi:molybdopterin molybdotransferase
MPEFFNVLAPADALGLLRARLSPRVETEVVATAEALGRVTAEEIRSPEDLPAFPRSSMDGYSVRASDTFGASEGLPAYLEVMGEVPMGQAPGISLSTGQAARAYTGGMLAKGADAVVIVENTQHAGESAIEVVRPVAPGENVIQAGEDVRRGELVLPAGHVMRPQDIGGLLALGVTEVRVGCRPRVAIVSTGDELVPPEAAPGPGQIRDINTYTISALVTQCGGVPIPVALVVDDYEAQRNAAVEALSRGDILVFSAGSSVSARDMTAEVINSLGSPGVLAHGISLKPGKPTIVGLVDGVPAFGLPGNPVSAMVVFDLLVRPTIYLLGGCEKPPEPPTTRARLTRDIASVAGREDYVQVKLVHQDGEVCAEPVFGKSNLIYTLIRADGVVKVPLDRGGLYAGEEVQVRLY